MKNKTKRNHSLYICIRIVITMIALLMGIVAYFVVNNELVKIRHDVPVIGVSVLAGIGFIGVVWILLENVRVIVTKDY